MRDDSAEAPLSIWDRQLPPQSYATNLKGVVDFCVSSSDFVFVLTKDREKQTIGVYSMVQKVFTLLTSIALLDTYTSMTCLDNNNVLLSPDTGSFTIFQYANNSLTLMSSMLKDAGIHSTVDYVRDILIFTNAASNEATFYDYNFVLKTLSFKLPPNSVFKIIQTRQIGILIALGREVGHYSSL